ncbi:MAG: hypothetical protein Tsb0016_11810 [Sphingomonadales bacterium]
MLRLGLWASMVRFDDRLRNLLALAQDKSPANRMALFRHLTDLLLQDRPLGDAQQHAMLMDILRQLRGEMPIDVRQEVAAALLAQAAQPMPLVRLLVVDDLPVARPLLDQLRLSDNDWLDLIADLPADHRRHLLIRSDLSPVVRRALKEEPALKDDGAGSEGESRIRKLFGQLAAVSAEHEPQAPVPPPIDGGWKAAGTAKALFGAAAPAAPQPAMPTAETEGHGDSDTEAGQVRQPPLPPIARALAKRRQAGAPQPAEAGVDWLWETDRLGRLIAIGGDPGCFLDSPGEAVIGGFLLDLFATGGAVATRLEQRMMERRPFRDEALVAKPEMGGGRWRLSGVAHFDFATGIFQGYRGTARVENMLDALRERQPMPDFSPPPSPPPQIDPVQWAHEMRTPLNAIKGFAELIESQSWGEVAAAYRDRSARIRQAAARADMVIGDLMTLARLQGDSMAPVIESLDINAVFAAALARLGERTGFDARLQRADPVPAASGDAALCQRVIEKMLEAGRAWTQAGEPVRARLGPDVSGDVKLAVALPRWRGDGGAADAFSAIGAALPAAAVLKASPPLTGLGLDFAAQLAGLMQARLELAQDSAGIAQLQLILPRAGQ